MILVVMIIRFFMRQGFHTGADRSHISEPSFRTKFAMKMNVRWHLIYYMGLSSINDCYRSEDEGRTSFLPTCRQVCLSYHDHIEDARFVLINVSDDDMNHGD